MSKKLKLPKIPSHVRVSPKETFEVVFTDSFTDPRTVGEMRLDTKQIVIKNGQSESEIFKTYIHELLHLLSDTNDAKLTERQVGIMEKAIWRFLRLNNFI